MSKWRLVGAPLLALALLLPDQAPAQETGRITGTVTDSALGRGLSNAQIAVAGTRLRAGARSAGEHLRRGRQTRRQAKEKQP